MLEHMPWSVIVFILFGYLTVGFMVSLADRHDDNSVTEWLYFKVNKEIIAGRYIPHRYDVPIIILWPLVILLHITNAVVGNLADYFRKW